MSGIPRGTIFGRRVDIVQSEAAFPPLPGLRWLDRPQGKRDDLSLTHIAVAVAGLAIFVSWFTVVSSRGLLTGLVASVAFGGAAALLRRTAARSLV